MNIDGETKPFVYAFAATFVVELTLVAFAALMLNKGNWALYGQILFNIGLLAPVSSTFLVARSNPLSIRSAILGATFAGGIINVFLILPYLLGPVMVVECIVLNSLLRCFP